MQSPQSNADEHQPDQDKIASRPRPMFQRSVTFRSNFVSPEIGVPADLTQAAPALSQRSASRGESIICCSTEVSNDG